VFEKDLLLKVVSIRLHGLVDNTKNDARAIRERGCSMAISDPIHEDGVISRSSISRDLCLSSRSSASVLFWALLLADSDITRWGRLSCAVQFCRRVSLVPKACSYNGVHGLSVPKVKLGVRRWRAI